MRSCDDYGPLVKVGNQQCASTRWRYVSKIRQRWIYLPMLLVAPTDVVALNFFFDTLLFCGAILLLANSIDKEPESPFLRLSCCVSQSFPLAQPLNKLVSTRNALGPHEPPLIIPAITVRSVNGIRSKE